MADNIYFENDLINEFLRKCRHNYPYMGEVQYLFYVALVDVDVYERAYENFSAMERFILANLYYGQRKIDLISENTGIPLEQVKDITKNLMASHQIDQNLNITDLGKSSLNDERKNLNGVRKIQVMADGLGGILIKQDLFRDHDLGSLDAINKLKIPTFIPTGEITTENFKSFYEQFNPENDIDNSIIPINFEKIVKVETKEIFYVPLYIAKFKNIEDPIILRKYSYFDEKDKFADDIKVLFMTTKQRKILKDLSVDYIISEKNSKDLIKNLKELYNIFTNPKNSLNIYNIANKTFELLGLNVEKEIFDDKSLIYNLSLKKDYKKDLEKYFEYIKNKEAITLIDANGDILYIEGKLEGKNE